MWKKKKKSRREKLMKSRKLKHLKKLKPKPFSKLPDEIILIIFTKMTKTTSLNSLVQTISLVSKRFATILRRIPSASVTLSISLPLPPEFYLFIYILQNYPFIHSLDITFIPKFEMKLPDNPPKIIKWKAMSNPRCQTFVFMSADSTTIDQDLKGVDQDILIWYPMFMSMEILGLWAYHHSNESCLWFKLIAMVIKVNPMIRTIKVCGPDKVGMLVFDNREGEVREEKDLLMRKLDEKLEINKIWNVMRFGYAPNLVLPETGMLMKEVLFGMFRVGEDARDEDGDGYEEIVEWEFEEGEEVFGEALRAFFKDKKNELKVYDRGI